MPLPPLPTQMGSILKDSELLEKASVEVLPEAKAVKTKKAPVAKKTIKESVAKPKVKATKTPAKATAPITKEETKKSKGYRAKTHGKKLFVLDTNVLMHDPMSLFQFEEHDVFLPMMTLEELDGHKKGMSDVSRNARQVSRYLDQLLGHSEGEITKGIELNVLGHTEASGKLFFQTHTLDAELPQGLPQGKADNQILAVVQALQNREKDRSVVLVSKDINMRIKATALGLAADCRNLNSYRCPSMKRILSSQYNTYGTLTIGTSWWTTYKELYGEKNTLLFKHVHSSGNYYYLRTQKLKNTSRFPLLVDTWGLGSTASGTLNPEDSKWGHSWYLFTPNDFKEGAVALVHNSRGTILFGDGHVSSPGIGECRQLGFLRMIVNGNPL